MKTNKKYLVKDHKGEIAYRVSTRKRAFHKCDRLNFSYGGSHYHVTQDI